MSGVLGGRITWRCRNICSALKLARQAGLSLPCLMLLLELTLFLFVWVFGYVWWRRGPEAISWCTQCDTLWSQGSWRVGWEPLSISSLISVPVPATGSTIWEGKVPEAAQKLEIYGAAQSPVVFLGCSSGYRCIFSRDCLTPYVFITVLIAKSHRAGLVYNACMN